MLEVVKSKAEMVVKLIDEIQAELPNLLPELRAEVARLAAEKAELSRSIELKKQEDTEWDARLRAIKTKTDAAEASLVERERACANREAHIDAVRRRLDTDAAVA